MNILERIKDRINNPEKHTQPITHHLIIDRKDWAELNSYYTGPFTVRESKRGDELLFYPVDGFPLLVEIVNEPQSFRFV